MTVLAPAPLASFVEDFRMSPGRVAGGFVFLTGVTGVAPDGSLSPDPETQIRTAFEQVRLILAEATLGMEAVVDVTSFHVGLQDHLATFKTVWAEQFRAPYPAWTAIEVAGFVTPGVVVEIKATAHADCARAAP
ncbi:MAG: Rid family hydrolase [Pseudomonadota bacterium]